MVVRTYIDKNNTIQKDKEINNLFTEIWIKENNINLF